MARLSININLSKNVDDRHEVKVSQINDISDNELLHEKDVTRNELGKLMKKLVGDDIDVVRKATQLFKGTNITIHQK